MIRAFCELNDEQTRIAVYFPYSEDAVAAIKGEDGGEGVSGRRFHRAKNGKPSHWTIPLDLTSANRLRECFGEGLTLGDGVRAWAREEKRRQRNLRSVANADDATLENIPEDRAAWLRPYQRADAKMMSMTNVLNANQPGVGKTVEVIYAIQEAQLPGPHLIIAPTTLFKDPWINEITEHVPGARILYGNTPDQRRGAINFVWMEWRDGTADDIWLILNPEMVRVARVGEGDTHPLDEFGGQLPILSKDHKGRAYVPKDGTTAHLFEIQWGYLETDEFHKYGLGADRNTQFARGLNALRRNAQLSAATSGTPMGGKPIRLWGILNFLEPEVYTSKWRWAEQWLVDEDGRQIKAGERQSLNKAKIAPGREEAFYEDHARHLIRRTRSEALPGLPPKQIIDVPVQMTAKQAKVYNDFVANAEAAIEGGRLSATGVLAEYARAKQLANALCEIRDGEVHPTAESGKLPILLDRLDTYGIRKADPEPGARAIVASESQRFVVLLEQYLIEAGLDVRRLDGTVKRTRDEVIDWYKDTEGEGAKSARVLVMTTQTGGVGLNLGMTGSIHIMDETWNPDDQEQLEDRGMRNRTTPLMVLYYRTEGTIQEYIAEVAAEKRITNKNIIDIRAEIARRKGRK
jgi:SNF2 family DNA or RNA helicase